MGKEERQEMSREHLAAGFFDEIEKIAKKRRRRRKKRKKKAEPPIIGAEERSLLILISAIRRGLIKSLRK